MLVTSVTSELEDSTLGLCCFSRLDLRRRCSTSTYLCFLSSVYSSKTYLALSSCT
jgi:hypothetical protein